MHYPLAIKAFRLSRFVFSLRLVVLGSADSKDCAKASAKRSRNCCYNLGISDIEYLIAHTVKSCECRDHAHDQPFHDVIDTVWKLQSSQPFKFLSSFLITAMSI